MQRCVAIVWTRAGLPHDGCVDCDVCEYSVVDGLARYIVRILSYRRLTPQICTRSRETLCTRPTLAGTPTEFVSVLILVGDSVHTALALAFASLDTVYRVATTHCIISFLIPFKEDVCTFLIFSYSSIDQQLLLKQFCSNRLSF